MKTSIRLLLMSLLGAAAIHYAVVAFVVLPLG